jgi:hypothetical protein
MNTFGLDEQTRLLIAKQHAEELRNDWQTANGPSRRLEEEAEEPCTDHRFQALGLWVTRLVGGLRRRARIAAADPCS